MLPISTNADADRALDSANKIDFAGNAEAAYGALAILIKAVNQPMRPDFVAFPFRDLELIAHLATVRKPTRWV